MKYFYNYVWEELKKAKNNIALISFTLVALSTLAVYFGIVKQQQTATVALLAGGFVIFLIVILRSAYVALQKDKLDMDASETKKREMEQAMRTSSAAKDSLEVLVEKYPNLKRIAIVGKGNVGKTKLIENICGIENKNETTQSKDGYLYNFSNNRECYAIISDVSGQSQSLQNDSAVKANILIVLLDHTEHYLEKEIQKKRLQDHESFIQLLKDRLVNYEHKISWICFLFNKSDLWSQLSDEEKTELKVFFNSQYEIFKSAFGKIEFECLEFSNEITYNRAKIINKILLHI